MKKIVSLIPLLSLVSVPIVMSSCSKEQSIKMNLKCSTGGNLLYKDSGEEVTDEKITQKYHCHGTEVHGEKH